MPAKKTDPSPGGAPFLIKMLAMMLLIGLAVLGVLLGMRYAAPLITGLLRNANTAPPSPVSEPAVNGKGDIEKRIRTAAAALDARPGDITVRGGERGSIREIRVRIPRGRPMEYVVFTMSQACNTTPYHVMDCVFNKRSRSCVITFSNANVDTFPGQIRLVLLQPDRFSDSTGRMAILIDDFGTIADQTTVDFLTLEDPFTVAVPAGPDMAGWAAQIAGHYRKEVCILLPMEPNVLMQSRRRDDMIMVHFEEKRVRGIIAKSVRSVPRYTGFCSYLGSRVLEDSRMTGIIFSEIRKQKGYFIDTREERTARASTLAKAAGIALVTPDAVIPREAREKAVDSLLVLYTGAAQKRGSLLVRGSCTSALVTCLKKRSVWIRQNGISLVYVSQLIDKKPPRHE